MTKQYIKFLMKADSMNESVLPFLSFIKLHFLSYHLMCQQKR